ncbi:MAG: TIGR02147 family protein [Chitinispirillaceae bacterium]|nr:TIGR02147 family protein [Chitinispirillaceae bacterium]
MKSIFEYIDYRKFLASYYNEKKNSSRFFSYRYFAQKAKIHSPSFLKHVIDGKRNLTRPMIENFCAGLGLTVKESRYFRNLVLFNQAKTSSEKQEYYTNLKSMIGAVKESALNADQFDFYSNWYTPVIRELLCQFDFKDDFKKIAAMLIPPILPSDAKKAIKLLLQLKLVRRRADGTYFQSDSAIVADNEVMSMAMRSFSKAMIEHSKNAIEGIDWRQRHISGLTIGISPETYDVLSAEIEAFKDRVKLIVNRDNESCTVYQMNLTLFPVTHTTRSSNGDKAADK